MAAVLMGLSWSLQVSSVVPEMVAAPAGKVTWGICKKQKNLQKPELLSCGNQAHAVRSAQLLVRTGLWQVYK